MSLPQIQPLDDLSATVANEYGYLGLTPALSLLSDPRFNYYLYVLPGYYTLAAPPRLLVLIHGSGRNPSELRSRFAQFAFEHNCFILCPLFPIGFLDPNDTDNYKLVKWRDVRYDQILLSMVDETKARFRKLDATKFCLYGFSGGGQFVHRFAYLHPHRLQALVCGAPGLQTPLDWSKSYPDGVQGLREYFDASTELDWETLQRVRSLFFCGELDTDTTYLKNRGRGTVLERGRLGGTTRLESSWRELGGRSKLIVVKGMRHEEDKGFQLVIDFLEKALVNKWVDEVLAEGKLHEKAVNGNKTGTKTTTFGPFPAGVAV